MVSLPHGGPLSLGSPWEVLRGLLGALWTLQGLGFVAWPPDSFMIGKRQWAYIGVLAMAAGVILVWILQKRRNGRGR